MGTPLESRMSLVLLTTVAPMLEEEVKPRSEEPKLEELATTAAKWARRGSDLCEFAEGHSSDPLYGEAKMLGTILMTCGAIVLGHLPSDVAKKLALEVVLPDLDKKVDGN
jgi:hypothetical protein